MHRFGPLAALVMLTACPVAAQDTNAAPLSAIDWLSRSVDATAMVPNPPESPVTNSASTPQVTVTPLDGPSPDPVGLLSASVTGLPISLWSASDAATLIPLLQAERLETLPAIQELITTLMLAEADPPQNASADGGLFLARVDKLLQLGALEPAQALLDQAKPSTPTLFRRWFDVSLLTGTEDHACDVMRANPEVTPTYPARIFCLARSGDWSAAALTLNTHRVLGDVSDEEDALISRFLDPALAENTDDLPPPTRVSPLVFRMREAIGQSLNTQSLPLAFAHADLRSTTGWKAQLEAAERLARYGAITPYTLRTFYTAHTPAASGGIWDRVAAVQRLDNAVRASDADAVAAALPVAWAAMKSAKLEVPLAGLYGADLQNIALDGDAAAVAVQLGLLSSAYETTTATDTGIDPFLVALAHGSPGDAISTDPRAIAIQNGFATTVLPTAFADLTRDGKLGESLLRAISLFNAGLSGDLPAITQALILLRSVGLEDIARRAALQLMILDRAA